MKKYLLLIFAVAFLFIPNNVKASTIELSQDDFNEACNNPGVTTAKGITYSYPSYFLGNNDYKLLSDIDLTFYKIMIDGSDYEISIDFNGHSYSGEFNANVSKLTLINGTMGNYSYINGDCDVLIDNMNFNGWLTFNNYDLNSNSRTNVTIKNGTFELLSYVGIGTSVIKNGVFQDFSWRGYAGEEWNESDDILASLVIDNATISDAIDLTYTDAIINDGNYSGVGISIRGGSKAIINGGEFTNSFNNAAIEISPDYTDIINDYYMYLSDVRSVVINGGHFISNSEIDGYGAYIISVGPSLPYIEINGGIFEGTLGSIYLKNEHTYGGNPTTNDVLSLEGLVSEDSKYSDLLRKKSEDGHNIILNNYISVLPNYIIYEGTNQKYKKGNDIIIKANGRINKFRKLLIDNTEVPETNYIKESGSTIITLKSDYLSSLDSGNHVVSFVYYNGSVDTNLEIPESNNPLTIDGILLYCIVIIISEISFIGLFIYTRRNKIVN